MFEKAWNEILYYKKNDNYKHLIGNTQTNLNGGVLHLNLENQCVLSDSEDNSE